MNAQFGTLAARVGGGERLSLSCQAELMGDVRIRREVPSRLVVEPNRNPCRRSRPTKRSLVRAHPLSDRSD